MHFSAIGQGCDIECAYFDVAFELEIVRGKGLLIDFDDCIKIGVCEALDARSGEGNSGNIMVDSFIG